MVSYIIPSFSPTGTWYIGEEYYGNFGAGMSGIALGVLSNLPDTVATLFTPEKIAFALHLFVPLAFIPLFGFEVTALALIPLSANLLSRFSIVTSLFVWHLGAMLPFVFFGAVLGMERLIHWNGTSRWLSPVRQVDPRSRKLVLATLVITASCASYYYYSPLPFARYFDASLFARMARSTVGRAALAQIPPAASVAVPDDAMPLVSHRRHVYLVPAFPDYRQVEYLFADTTQFWYAFHKDAWGQLLETGFFEILEQREGFLLARRRPVEPLPSIRFQERLALVGYALPPTAPLRGGQTIRPILVWRALQPMPQTLAMRVQVQDVQGRTWAEFVGEPQDGRAPTWSWTVNDIIYDQYALGLPSVMPPGDYRLVVSVYDMESGRTWLAQDATQAGLGSVTVTSIRVEKDKSNITATNLQNQNQLDHPYFVDLRELRLLGFKRLPESIIAGDYLAVGLFWRARQLSGADYLVSLQLTDSTGTVFATHEARPAQGVYPTTEWSVGEVLLDWHDLALPTSMPSGEYTLRVSLHDASNRQKVAETILTRVAINSR